MNRSPLFIFTIWSILFILASCNVQKTQKTQPITYADVKHPKREFRGAWISTMWQSKYKTMNSEQMKLYFSELLNSMQKDGINAIVFQVRPQADALYKSKHEPWSSILTGKQGQAPDNGFDPLAYMIDQCHIRGMELHAWLNPYRAKGGEADTLAANHLFYREPHRFVAFDGKQYFDPGLPENRKTICDVVQDITQNYDIDAIHIDDYFYPYPVAGKSFNDSASFATYGLAQGFKDNQLADWRRNNVNLLVKEIKQTVVKTKPWVRFGVSSFGIYRNKRSTADGSGSDTAGLQCYDDIYADVMLWLKNRWVDYNVPQLYWEIGHKLANYTTLVDWWSKNTQGMPLYVGQHIRRTMDAPMPSGATNQLDAKLQLSRTYPHVVAGNCFWVGYDFADNYKNVEQGIQKFHQYPALIPPYTHMSKSIPLAVSNIRDEYMPTQHVLQWQSNHLKNKPQTAQYYVVYRFAKGERVDVGNSSKIVATVRKPQYILPYERGKNTYTYVVTAVDAYHNESEGISWKVKL